jgi:hypothetical protein
MELLTIGAQELLKKMERAIESNPQPATWESEFAASFCFSQRQNA